MDLPPLSDKSRETVTRAAIESGNREHYYLGVEHLFAAVGAGGNTSLEKSLEGQGVRMTELHEELMAACPVHPQRPWGNEIHFTPRCQEVLRIASRLAARRGVGRVEDIHILEAILNEGRNVPVRHLRGAGVNVADLYEATVPPAPAPRAATPTPTLDKFGRDLTERARSGALSPVIGRNREIEEIAQVLLRRNKNNPILIGAAGVGKTAIVEGLAQRLVSGDCPVPLQGRRLIELSLSAMLAGTKYRGDFEKRLLDVVQEAESDDRLILFLDEIHALAGAGASEGAMNASDMLKPMLARGDSRCIGATTVAEYRRFIEPDPALDRRFEKILVEEPGIEQARRMLQGVAETLSAFHEVDIASEATKAALELTVRYVPQRRLPDKAIDALDQSCARIRLNAAAARRGKATVGADDIARTVAQWTGMPLERVSGSEAQHLLEFEEKLAHRVVGQDHAVAAVARAVITARAGLADPRRPAGVFLFLGPTGVGKTELARALAEQNFGDEKRLLRFDMSEFSEAHSVAGLIGPPPGYVGHDREGRLIEAVRTTPHCVVLFDEVEKAHPQLFDLFLQMFDEGRLTGTTGATADFRHAIIILTSNINPTPPPAEKHVGFLEDVSTDPMMFDLRALLGAWFRPELINRFDEVVGFRPLGARALSYIVDRHVAEIERLGADRGLELQLDDAVRGWIIERSDPGRFGARELRRVVDRCLRQPLARILLERTESAGPVRVSVEGEALRFD